MNELQVFNNIEFGEIKVIIENNIEWFNANDVCNALKYKNSREALRKHVDEDDVAKRDAIVNTGLGDYKRSWVHDSFSQPPKWNKTEKNI